MAPFTVLSSQQTVHQTAGSLTALSSIPLRVPKPQQLNQNTENYILFNGLFQNTNFQIGCFYGDQAGLFWACFLKVQFFCGGKLPFL
jgi:hypothetical protein